MSACESGVSFYTNNSKQSKKKGFDDISPSNNRKQGRKNGIEKFSHEETFNNLQDIIKSNNQSPKSPTVHTLVLKLPRETDKKSQEIEKDNESKL